MYAQRYMTYTVLMGRKANQNKKQIIVFVGG